MSILTIDKYYIFAIIRVNHKNIKPMATFKKSPYLVLVIGLFAVLLLGFGLCQAAGLDVQFFVNSLKK